MKKSLLNTTVLITVLLFSSLSFAQKKTDNIFKVEEERENDIVLTSKAPGTPGDPEPVPVDDYIPILLITGAFLAVYYARRRDAVTK